MRENGETERKINRRLATTKKVIAVNKRNNFKIN